MEDNKKFITPPKRTNKKENLKDNEKNTETSKSNSKESHKKISYKNKDEKYKTNLTDKHKDQNLKITKSSFKEKFRFSKNKNLTSKNKKVDNAENDKSYKTDTNDLKNDKNNFKSDKTYKTEKKLVNKESTVNNELKDNTNKLIKDDTNKSYKNDKKLENKSKSNKNESSNYDMENFNEPKNKIKSTIDKSKASYKRSDSKYSKDKIKSSRSNPKWEYLLDDADENEKELVLKGTISDRLNVLALLCTRNPCEGNYKQLLQFCENQRNDVIYATLKLLRDLIKEKPIESIYIKGRILKSFEMGCKNQYIKDKIIQIVGVLARADIYSEDFINILLTRLIEKGKPLILVEEALKSMFSCHEQLICDGIEDSYFKNDNFRIQYNILKFIQQLEINSTKKQFFSFYNNALSTLEEYPQDQKDLMIELLVNGLSRTISEGEKIDSIDLIRKYVKSARSIISCLNLLIITKDQYAESYVLKVSRTNILRNTRYEPEFLNMVYKLTNKDLFCKLIDNSFYYSVHSILSLMLIAYSKRIDTNCMFSLRLFLNHYNPVVRDVAQKMLNNERIYEFDPFDKVYLDGLAKRLENR